MASAAAYTTGFMDSLPSWGRRLVLGLAAWAMAQATYAAWREDWTLDERVHLEWSRRLLDAGVTERDSAGRFDSKTPVSLMHVLARRAAGGEDDQPRTRLLTRVPTLLCLLALLATTFGLAREIFGSSAAWTALGLLALDPNPIAHASVATVDVPYALATLLTLWTALRLVRRPSVGRTIALGASLGFALLAKFTGVLLLPGLVALPLVAAPEARREWRPARVVGAMLMAALVAALVLCAGYLFTDVAQPWGEIGMKSRPFQSVATVAPWLRLPLPAAFITGIDRSLASERSEWGVVVFGRRFPHGVWYYFVVAWLLKTPLALLAAQVAGSVRAVRAGRWRERPALFLVFSLALALVYFSFLFQTQLGYRFVLACVPISYVLAAPGLTAAWSVAGGRYAVAAAALTVLEGMAYVGNPLSFTNAAVWPKRLAFRVLADSNLDWGQNRDKIGRWLAERQIPADRLDPLHALPGINVFTLNVLTGAGVFDFERHRWLREHASPVEHLGHTYLLFDVSDELYDRLLTESRQIRPSPLADEVCPDPGTQQPPGSRLRFAFDGPAQPSRAWLICVTTDRGTDLALHGARGGVRVGPLLAQTDPPFETVGQDQDLWFRLEPGRHVLLARAIENRRAWLPSPFEGEWHVRRRGARISVQEVAR
jgi:hypothetical protein